MPLQISISNAIGSRGVTAAGGYDPDAQAFITAASITDPTQQAAINQLVLDLKGYSIWTKMQAIYPMVGGTNAQHTWNLKNTAQFQISWQGGVVSSANGVQFNGINSYGITNYNPSINGTLNSHHFSFYSRTNSNGTEIEAGVIDNTGNNNLLEIRTSGITYVRVNAGLASTSFSDSDSRAFYLGNRTASNVLNIWRNSVKAATGTTASVALPNGHHWIGAWNNLTNPNFLYFTTKQCAFASIGDGLTDTEAANFYTAVQAFQTTLGRSIGTQTVSDADAQAFVTNAGIVDQVEANAVNNLVIGLKADSLWTKMKAIYPFVGGTATTHKYNLKNPLDTDAAFRLVFNGGWTHSSTGSTPNGSNGYADTKLATTGNIAQNSASMGVYSRNNTATTGAHGIRPASITGLFELFERYTDNNFYCYLNDSGGFFGTSVLDSRGFNQGSRTASNVIRYNRNTTTNTGITNSNATSTLNAYIGASNTGTGATFYNNREIAFFYIGDGLTNTEMQNYYTRVQTFQTALNRNV